jgi:HAD superfamily hydrolase (TIGR01484 family)
VQAEVHLSYYERELGKLANTYATALRVDVTRLKKAVAGASESSVIGIGSGGSFTVASLLCNLHETHTGRVSRPSTPLEIICNPNLAAACPVFLISAEGKNPDIIEAMERAREYSARSVHVVTNRDASPLADSIKRFSEINTHVFPLAEKDGYLATNSLLMNCVVVARAYGELNKRETVLPASIDRLTISGRSLAEWTKQITAFAKEMCNRGSAIIVYTPLLRPVALDLESKLSESAMAHSQLTDLRSFAHGRHLWLAERPSETSIIALIEPSLNSLWTQMTALLPKGVPVLSVELDAARPAGLIAGIVGEMQLVGEIARCLRKDPGKPDVPAFGRELHYTDLSKLVPSPAESSDRGEQSKYDVLGARWPYLGTRSAMERAADAYVAALERRTFRSIVFDYDGTLCTSQREEPPPQSITSHLAKLIDHGVIVAIVSGRGASVQDQLRNVLPQPSWQKVVIGLYSAGHITDLSTPVVERAETSEFLSHANRIISRLKGLGVPIERVKATHPYQVSVRFQDGVATEQMWFVVADALRQAGLEVYRLVRSRHSVDILAPGLSKSRLLAHIIQAHKVDPYQVLAVGDQGAWPGNDYDLLEHRFSLSVDWPSRHLDRGWKIAPPHRRNVDATLWYLERVELLPQSEFRLRFGSAARSAAQ